MNFIRSSLLAVSLLLAVPILADEIHLVNCRGHRLGRVGYLCKLPRTSGALASETNFNAPPPEKFYARGENPNGRPAAGSSCAPAHGGNLVTWEGRTISCTFPTSVTATVNIDGNAQSAAFQAVVG